MNSAIVAVEIVAKLIGEYRGDKTATGPKLSARHSSKYKDTGDFATEFKPDTL